jgi:glutamate-ammonia-ligase adenylyltransferase
MTRPENPAGSTGSRFVQRIRRRYPSELALLPPGLPGNIDLLQLTRVLQGRGEASDTSLGHALRVTRQLTLERLATMDCTGQADVAQITGAMTLLAELALELAYSDSYANLKAQHGEPLSQSGAPARLLVLGMGKLGARELNVSSDIDLIYVYDQDGETSGDAQGRGRISNHEFFARMVRSMSALLDETTEHGFVFRIDLALRPNGNSGPPAVSLGALEEYFHVQGREWERFAWLKSRVIAPQACVGSPLALQLRGIVLPFVFRRYLDYGVFDSLRVLHRQIRDHAAKRSAGRPERSNDVKLSRGGIREIEFTVQLLQVVRGGQFPDLRTRPTLSALQRLVQAGLMPLASAEALADAYQFLRRVEHRIQYLDDQQTHVLPTNEEDLLWIAHTMGLTDSGTLLRELDRHREMVAQEFDALLGGSSTPCKNCNGTARADTADLDTVIDTLGGDFKERAAQWRSDTRVLNLREESRQRLARLLQRTAQWLQEGLITEESALRLIDWVESLRRRESYLALLLERPLVHQRLLRMLGAARWPARYLLSHPGVIDELADERVLDERFDAMSFEADVQRRLKALQDSGEDDDESLLNLLRRAHHAEVFRTLARDVDGRLSVEQVADDLSALAQSVLGLAARWCWSRLKNKHTLEPLFGVIAYGKLGGKELGYGSDLDLVFVYDDADDRAPEVYSALVRKLINWLTVKTGEGDLYEIDTALRPNGSSGLLVSSFDAYANYQQQRGSNTAWTWEHQAITRARCVWGSASLVERFEAVRAAVLASPRDAASLRDEIRAMREKVRASHPCKPGWFDVKHSPGGMVDIEFVVQYLVLSSAGEHPILLANVGNIALLQHAQACGLLPAPLGDDAAQAYRELRQMQHKARLDEAKTQVEEGQSLPSREAGLALWRAVFELSVAGA